MAQALIATNLPVFFRCFRIPAEWRLGRFTKLHQFDDLQALARVARGEPEQDSSFLTVHYSPGTTTTYNPWEKRDEFFRLKPDDTEGLIRFLGTVGLFERVPKFGEREESPDFAVARTAKRTLMVPYLSNFRIDSIWEARRLLQNSLGSLDKHTGEQIDFHTQIVRSKERAQVNVTTTTFLEAILLTLSVDRVQKAKVLKCARPDCPVTFSFTSGHRRKYCSWDCGHLESVRRQRRNLKSGETNRNGIASAAQTLKRK